MQETLNTVRAIVDGVEEVILGKREQIHLVLCSWLAGGHVLIEDVPGTGKTMLARALARSVNVDFKRVQFTPDLLPSDILGSSILDQSKGAFVFQPGPIFTTVLLGDEINRATPRTQSALLEAMAESQVSVDGKTWRLNPLFFVIATQNPVESHGTFPLPEAQLDRFMMKVSVGYPDRVSEMKIVRSQNVAHPIHKLEPRVSVEAIERIRGILNQVEVTDDTLGYAMQIIEGTRKDPELSVGASPRALLALVKAAQAMALIEGKHYVSPSTIFKLAKPVLAHRLIPNGEAKLKGLNGEEILDGILKRLRVPTRGE